jgi:hypothetical protein
MDDVIFSRIFLLGNFDNFMNLKRTCKRAHKVSKIVWKQWIADHTKRYVSTYHNGDEIYATYTYYNGKNGKHILYGLYYRPDRNVENYQHGKLHGEQLIYIGQYLHRKMNYERGALQGPMIIYAPSERVRSVRFYHKGRKCCSISNDYDHFCPTHYKFGMKFMNWTRQKYLSGISQPVIF